MLCEIFKIPRSNLYYKRKQEFKDTVYKTRIQVLHIFEAYYWQRRLSYHFWVNHKKIERISQKYWLYAKTRTKRKFSKPWDKNLPHMWVENKKKDILIEKVHEVWSSDFTHLYWQGMEFYLATVLDEYSRKIVGYSLAKDHWKEIIFQALNSAIEKEKTTPKILHSDQGSEYRSYEYFSILKKYSIWASMSKKACPWENGSQESFYGKFKFELWNLNRYPSFEEAIEAIHLWIYYYNNERIHTALKMSPQRFIEIRSKKEW